MDNTNQEEHQKELEEIKKKAFNIHVNVDVNHIAKAPDEEKVKKNRFLLIRHGVTDFNVVFGDCLKNFGEESEEFRNLKSDPKYIDIELKAEGIV